jgi:hypothetical protein
MPARTVPDTNTFTLDNVRFAVGAGYVTLADCFAYADPTYFDPNYSGSKNSLLNFRNYHPPVGASLSIDNQLVEFNTTPVNAICYGYSRTINVTCSGSWNVTRSDIWFNCSPVGGTGNGSVLVTCQKGVSGRSGTLTFASSGAPSQVCTVAQDAGCAPV